MQKVTEAYNFSLFSIVVELHPEGSLPNLQWYFQSAFGILSEKNGVKIDKKYVMI